MWTYESHSFSPRTSLCKVSATPFGFTFFRMYLGLATTLPSEQAPSGVTAEGGANVYVGFGCVCSIFPVLLLRAFPCNVPPRARFINVWVVEFRTAGGAAQ